MNSKVSTASRAWQHVDGPSEEEKRNNRFLNPKASEEQDSKKDSTPISLDGFFEMENISCYDANGKITEHYPELYVAKDVLREIPEKPRRLTLIDAITECEKEGLFLPSMALTSAIIVRLYENRNQDPFAMVVLQLYFNYWGSSGYFVQNTILDGTKAIHYPSKLYGEHGKKVNIGRKSIKRQLVFSHPPATSLKNALNDSDKKRLVHNLTGLRDPGVLVEICSEFKREANYVGFVSDDVHTVWLGGGNGGFDINFCGQPDWAYAARGVKIVGDSK